MRLNTWPIIQNHSDILDDVIDLVYLRYPRQDYKLSLFQGLLKVNNYPDLDTLECYLPEDDIKQSLYLRWHEAIVKLFCTGSELKTSLRRHLLNISLICVTQKIYSIQKINNTLTLYPNTKVNNLISAPSIDIVSNRLPKDSNWLTNRLLNEKYVIPLDIPKPTKKDLLLMRWEGSRRDQLALYHLLEGQPL